jgi:hypothetical protein
VGPEVPRRRSFSLRRVLVVESIKHTCT